MKRWAAWIVWGAALAGVTGIYVWGDAAPELAALNPEHVTAVDGVGTVDGNELTLTDVAVVRDEDHPAGTQTIVVGFDVVPDPVSKYCAAPQLVEDGPGGRTWVAGGRIPGWDPYGDGLGDNKLCGSDEGPARVTVGFLVPDDIRGPLRIQIDGNVLLGERLWFPLASDALRAAD